MIKVMEFSKRCTLSSTDNNSVTECLFVPEEHLELWKKKHKGVFNELWAPVPRK